MERGRGYGTMQQQSSWSLPHCLWSEFALTVPHQGARLLAYSTSNALRARPGLLLAFSTWGDSYGSSQPLGPMWIRCSMEISIAKTLLDTGLQQDLLFWSSHDDVGCVNWRWNTPWGWRRWKGKVIWGRWKEVSQGDLRSSTSGLEEGEGNLAHGH